METWTCSCKEVKTHPMTKATCYRCFDERDEVVALRKQEELRDSLVADMTPELDRVRYAISGACVLPIPDDEVERTAQALEAADISEWLDDGATTHRCNCILEPAQLVHQPNEMTAEYFEWTCPACGMRLTSEQTGCPNCGGMGDGCYTDHDLYDYSRGG